MNNELDEALVRDFPNLYAQREGSMMSTLMCWGFECGDGWEPLLRRCSEKLEKIIVDSGIENKITEEVISFKEMKRWEFIDHEVVYFDEPAYTEETLEAHLNAHPWIRNGNGWNEEDKSYIRYENPIWSVCASQVKEKYGTLRFYMAGYLPGMDEAIDEAENASAKTCEKCGGPGEVRDPYGWVTVRCNPCYDEYCKSY